MLIIYPVAIALIVVTLLQSWLAKPERVMAFVLIPVGLISLVEGLHAAGLAFIEPAYAVLAYLPLQTEGLVWLLPGILGGIFAMITSVRSSQDARPVQG